MSAAGPFAEAGFKHPWRPYQRRVLASLEHHLSDRKLHVVAPPGSGKTILGLEVLRRIGRPALVLTPTITVREQWLRRLQEDFLERAPAASEVSRDLKAPAALTVSTYQALAREFQRGKAKALVRSLEAAGLATLVVDEAHHLRRHWWSCLDRLERELGGPRVVALTATPPYDVPRAEWNRYAGFCGPVDEEIGVPELVREGNLCPHQDFVYLSLPATADAARMRRFDRRVDAFLADLAIDVDLARLLAADPRVASPAEHAEELLAERDLFLALAIFLRGLRYEAARPLLAQMDLLGVELPRLDREWAEALLDGVLFDESWSARDPEGLLRRLRRRLDRLGAIERRRVSLHRTRRDLRALGQSPTKLASICRIVEAECSETAERRLVVLADYIRESALPRAGDGTAPRPFVKIGVVPIFESLRRLRLPGLRLCALTGRLVLLPRRVAEELPGRIGDLASRLGVRPLPHAPDFVRVRFREQDRRRCVGLVTELFAAGAVNGIVGTAALLGEGWDAPEVDTLILASSIGAYVSSNQMRGRAIRALPRDRSKTANIWHLACVDAAAPAPGGGEDLAALRRRFDSFVGLALEGPVIESGVGRLGAALEGTVRASVVEAVNARMVRTALDRRGLRRRWREAAGAETTGHERLVRELRVPARQLVLWLARSRRPRSGWRGAALAWIARRRLLAIGRAVARALAAARLIAPGWRVETGGGGPVCRVTLEGARHREQARFVDTLAEVLDLLSSPRYLLYRGRRYHAVPAWFGENRRRAAIFARAWNRPLARRVARYRLVFTRNPLGRRHLLRATRRHLLTYHEARVEVRTSWRT